MISDKKLAAMFVLQDKMNLAIDPYWLDAGWDFHRAMMHEAVELQGHLGWKWWKKQVPDVVQAKIELVDIWHFVLSYFLEQAAHSPNAGDLSYAQTIDVAVALTNISASGDENTRALPGHSPTFSGLHNLNEKIDAFVGLVAFDHVYVFAFNILMQEVGLTWEELERLYVGKNTLNLFRQANGYKQGTYVKVWDGEEDNVVLERIMDKMPDATAADLMAALQLRYESLDANAT